MKNKIQTFLLQRQGQQIARNILHKNNIYLASHEIHHLLSQSIDLNKLNQLFNYDDQAIYQILNSKYVLNILNFFINEIRRLQSQIYINQLPDKHFLNTVNMLENVIMYNVYAQKECYIVLTEIIFDLLELMVQNDTFRFFIEQPLNIIANIICIDTSYVSLERFIRLFYQLFQYNKNDIRQSVFQRQLKCMIQLIECNDEQAYYLQEIQFIIQKCSQIVIDIFQDDGYKKFNQEENDFNQLQIRLLSYYKGKQLDQTQPYYSNLVSFDKFNKYKSDWFKCLMKFFKIYSGHLNVDTVNTIFETFEEVITMINVQKQQDYIISHLETFKLYFQQNDYTANEARIKLINNYIKQFSGINIYESKEESSTKSL